MRRTPGGLLLPGYTFTASCVGCDVTQWRSPQEWQAHVGPCARRHLDEIREQAGRNEPDELFAPWDPEYAEHMRKVGQRMLRERRLETRPHER